jgi:hypothetical protein
MGLINYINNLIKNKEKNGYKYLYFMIDVHNTILVPSFDEEENFIFYEYAKEVLQELTKRSDIKLIMWTSTYPERIGMYLQKFEEEGIHFDYVNSNPEMQNSSFGCFDTKFYFDVVIDDKSGFNAKKDWEKIWFMVLNDNKK